MIYFRLIQNVISILAPYIPKERIPINRFVITFSLMSCSSFFLPLQCTARLWTRSAIGTNCCCLISAMNVVVFRGTAQAVSLPFTQFPIFSLASLKSSFTCCNRAGQHTTSTTVIARALAVLRVNNWAFSAPGVEGKRTPAEGIWGK